MFSLLLRDELPIKLEEMNAATDARIVVSDEMFTSECGCLVIQVNKLGCHLAQVIFDGQLVLRGGWHDVCHTD